MNDVVSFSRWLKRRRKERDLTQEDLAERVGCSIWTIRKIEAGERRPSRQLAELLADCFGVEGDERGRLVRWARNVGPESLRGQPAETLHTQHTTPSKGSVVVGLPAQLTPLIGREDELTELRVLLASETARLVTLLGPPGIGKTRLSLAAVEGLATGFLHGAFFVPLAAITNHDLVLPTVAQMLGLREGGAHNLPELLAAHLREKQALLILDNFEQVTEAGPALAGLLARCPLLKALVTSRAALRVRGERVFPLSTLRTPDPRNLPDIETLRHYPAVALFLDRAKAANPGLRLTEENARAIAAICARLEGLPLAIELVAARTTVLSPTALLARLSNSLALLKGGPRDLPPRHKTLRDAIAWSYDLLDEGEQILFARLGVFSGGCTISALEAVCNATGDLPLDALEITQSLVDKSLLRLVELAGGAPRLAMLETIREYARERLDSRAEGEEIRRWHAEYYLALAEAADPQLAGAEQKMWLDRLEEEHDNLRSALSWALDSAEEEIAGKLGAALGQFWYTHGHLSEGRSWLSKVLDLREAGTGISKSGTWAKVLVGVGMLAYRQGDFGEAEALFRESLGLYRKSGDRHGMALALNRLGVLENERGEFTKADLLYEESLALWRELGDRQGLARILNNVANQARARGEYGRAVAMYRESLALSLEFGDERSVALARLNLGATAILDDDWQGSETLLTRSLESYRTLGNKGGEAAALNFMGWAMMHQSKYEVARERFEASLALCDELGDKQGIGSTRKGIGYAELCMGDYHRAKELLLGSLSLFVEIGDRINAVDCIQGLAALAAAEGDAKRAARLFGFVDTFHSIVGFKQSASGRAFYEGLVAPARAALSEAEFTEIRNEGSAMALEQVVEYALAKQGGQKKDE